MAHVLIAAAVVAPATSAAAAPDPTRQAAPGDPEVTVTDLVELPPSGPVAGTAVYDINNSGQVVGESRTAPVLWEDGQPTRLPLRGTSRHAARHINDRGEVVVDTGFGAYHWLDGQVTDLDAPGEEVEVVDLNESGQVLLTRSRNGMTSYELWQDGVATDLRLPAPPDGLSIRLRDLSDGGHVIGEYGEQVALFDIWVWSGTGGLFVWRAGTSTRLTSSWVRGTAVNRDGQVVGEDLFGGVLWSGGRSTRLGFEPVDINDRGQVAGIDDQSSAVVWENGRLTELPRVGGETYTRPYAVNERGQVLGYSSTPGESYHTFLWTSGRMVDLGLGAGPSPEYALNDEGQAIGVLYEGTGGRPVMWEVHDDGGPTEPPTVQCFTATNQAHVQAGRATSWSIFTWTAGSGTYLGLTLQTTSLRETTPGTWEPVTTC